MIFNVNNILINELRNMERRDVGFCVDGGECCMGSKCFM